MTHELLEEGRVFALSLLPRSERAVVRRFAKPVTESSVDDDTGTGTMQGEPVHAASTGAPILDSAVAWLDCEVRHVLALGSHSWFVGEVVDCGGSPADATRRPSRRHPCDAGHPDELRGLTGPARGLRTMTGCGSGVRPGRPPVPSDEACGGGPEVDAQGQDPVLEGRLGVSEHGVVHVVELGLLREALALGALDGREAPGAHRGGPGAEALHHGGRIELLGHAPTLPAACEVPEQGRRGAGPRIGAGLTGG